MLCEGKKDSLLVEWRKIEYEKHHWGNQREITMGLGFLPFMQPAQVQSSIYKAPPGIVSECRVMSKIWASLSVTLKQNQTEKLLKNKVHYHLSNFILIAKILF